MLRLVALAAAMVVSATSLELRAANAENPPTIRLDVGGGVAETARVLRAAVKQRRLDGYVWLGKLRGVGGGRDTIVYVPRGIDVTKPIELVVYMEGIDSFSPAAIRGRHVNAMAKLDRNTVYVAPDAPSSHYGFRNSTAEHWQAGCAERTCDGGHAAPGDFVVFLDEVRSKLSGIVGGKPDVRVSLIGFSRGGKGVLAALRQLDAAKFEIRGHAVKLGEVVFADGNYLDDALTGSWAILESRPEAPRFTILVGEGEFTTVGGDGNRRRALAFWQQVAPTAPLPTATRGVSAPRLRLIPLAGGHGAIGDAAIGYLESSASKRVAEAS